MLDDPGRVRGQITSVVCQIQRFGFDCNLVVTRKINNTDTAGLGLNPLRLFVFTKQKKDSCNNCNTSEWAMRSGTGGCADRNVCTFVYTPLAWGETLV